MKIIAVLLLLQLISCTFLSGQSYNPISIRQNVYGHLQLSTSPLDELTHVKNMRPFLDSSHFIKCITYESSPSTMIVSGNYTYIKNYLDFSAYSADYLSNRKEVNMLNFPILLARTIKKIKENEFVLEDFNKNSPYSQQTESTHRLRLHYNNKGQISTIKEVYLKYNEAGDTITFNWLYTYEQNRIKMISVDKIKTLFEYDAKGNLIWAISFSGQFNFKSPYFCEDTLVSFNKAKTVNKLINLNYNNDSCLLYQLAFFNYSKGKLKQVVAYHANLGVGVQKSRLSYDALQRISSLDEDDLQLSYTYEKKSNRLLQRTERMKDCRKELPCPEWVWIDTYYYDKSGKVIEIKNKTFQEYYDGAIKKYGYTNDGKGKVFEYP